MALDRVRLEAAERDIDGIWLYIAADNLNAANRLVDEFVAAERRLADFPNLGRARPEVGPGVRSWPVRGYIMLYRITGSTLLIERLVHGARDTAALIDKRNEEL